MAYILGGRSIILILIHLNQLGLTVIVSDIQIVTGKAVTYVYDEMLKCMSFHILVRLAICVPLLLWRCSALKRSVKYVITTIVGITYRVHDCECIFNVRLIIIDLRICTKYLFNVCGWWETV